MYHNNQILEPKIGSCPGDPLVLYFHHIHPNLDHYTSIKPEIFTEFLEKLLKKFDPYNPKSLMENTTTYKTLKPTVLITFDDGYQDNIAYARPILNSMGISSLFFICTQLFQRNYKSPNLDYMTLKDIDLLINDGHMIGSHTRYHTKLTEISLTAAKNEITLSLNEIKDRYGTNSSKLFAYPFGEIPKNLLLPQDLVCFGTVKAPPIHWDESLQRIRRTYLPVDLPQSMFDLLIDNWIKQWYGML